MATINIGQSNAGDEFYRYKMPALQSKIEGRGNGIKTNVMNMVDVAKALGRPASYTTKYFGTELGAQTKFDEASGLAIVNGAHETNRLSQLLEGFIKRFVQCGQCNNPETEIVLTKKETIELHCKACGAVTQVDMRHKLCTFILKNPPVVKDKSKKLRRAEKERMKEGEAIDKAEKEARKKAKAEKKDKDKDKDKKEKKSKKKAAGSDEDANGGAAPAGDNDSGSGGSDDDDDDDDDDEVTWSTDTSAAAAAARAAEQLSDAAAAMVKAPAPAGASSDAAADAAKHLAGVSLAANGEDEEEDDDEDPLVAGLRKFAASHNASEVASHLKAMKADNMEHRMHVLVAALLDCAEGAPALSKQVSAKAAVLKACVPDAPTAGAMLASLERWLVDDAPHVLATKQGVATALNALYDADVLDEPSILAWADNAAAARKLGVSSDDAKTVRKAAAPFVEWLRTAESDEEDE